MAQDRTTETEVAKLFATQQERVTLTLAKLSTPLKPPDTHMRAHGTTGHMHTFTGAKRSARRVAGQRCPRHAPCKKCTFVCSVRPHTPGAPHDRQRNAQRARGRPAQALLAYLTTTATHSPPKALSITTVHTSGVYPYLPGGAPKGR
jgi:hypothetical protein